MALWALDRHREIDLWITASRVTDTDPTNRDQTRVWSWSRFRPISRWITLHHLIKKPTRLEHALHLTTSPLETITRSETTSLEAP